MTCPRCHAEPLGRFYGPCEECQGELRFLATQAVAVRNVIYWMVYP